MSSRDRVERGEQRERDLRAVDSRVGKERYLPRLRMLRENRAELVELGLEQDEFIFPEDD